MQICSKNKKGLMVMALAAGLCFVGIIFISLIERMRHEAAITNRVSINERLNQLASAVGRISIRKLQKDIELRDEKHGQAIIDLITVKHATGAQPAEDFTDIINDMKVIKALKDEFKKKWGKQGELTTFKVEYRMDLGPEKAFSKPIDGIADNNIERKGHIDMDVTVGIDYGVKRKYTIRKEFIFARLLAPPFYRFTLFSHNGANIEDDLANSITYDDTGKVTDGNKRPLVCLNRIQTNDTKNEVNYVGGPENVVKNRGADAYIKNGWIYLGGNGTSKDMRGDSGKLILNIVPGIGDDEYKSKFGEYFHFYYDKDSAGWLSITSWSDWLKNNVTGNGSGICSMVFINYGLYNGLLDIQFGSKMTDYYLFKNKVASLYKNKTGMSGNLNYGSAMHLFGTPNHCTPTIIFGQVQRRYLRCFALYYSDLKKVFPLRVVTDTNNNKSLTSLWALYSGDIYVWYLLSKGGAEQGTLGDAVRLAFLSNFYEGKVSQAFNIYYNGTGNLCGIGPKITDEEPYMMGLQNIAAPKNPELSWKDAVKAPNYCKDKPDDLCVDDYYFNGNDEEIHYTGNIQDILIDYDDYLKDRTSYTLGEGKEITMKDEFIQKHFFTDDNKKEFFLNQIIRIKGNLNIDEKLTVAKGGIIICDGEITVSAPIINKYIEGASADDPDSFGFLTLIAKKGINIKSTAGTNASPLPVIHGFFIAGCGPGTDSRVRCDKPMHIIGGVAADRIDNLVKDGAIIEWGNKPGESSLLELKDYYGLTLGPRDIEIYTGE